VIENELVIDRRILRRRAYVGRLASRLELRIKVLESLIERREEASQPDYTSQEPAEMFTLYELGRTSIWSGRLERERMARLQSEWKG